MAKYKGSDFRIKVRTSTGPDVFAVIGGGKTDSLSISNETVDVTDKDSSGARQLLEGAGVRAYSCKVSGVVSDNVVFTDHVMVAANANTHIYCKIESGTGEAWAGLWAISSCERSGEYNKEENFSMSLESAGIITYTAVP